MPLLDGDLYEIMMACVEGRLPSASARWHEGAACTVVAASEGYPQAYAKVSTAHFSQLALNCDWSEPCVPLTTLNDRRQLTRTDH